MTTKGIRGATTAESNTSEGIKNATLELLYAMCEQNDIKKENISHVIFTTTKDLNADFPAKFARVNMGWDDVAMMCFHEMDVKNSLKLCIRVMIVLNCNKDFKPKFVYLKGAKSLRA